MEHGSDSRDELAILCPVYDDWDSARQLVLDLLELQHELPPVRLFFVDDGSLQSPDLQRFPSRGQGIPITILRAGANFGHQRAIAIGLAKITELTGNRLIAIMDADGEDNPKKLTELIQELELGHADVVVATRASRNESFAFRLFYRFFRIVFRAFTGQSLDFGNFSVIRRHAAERLLFMPELWNHYPAAIMRSRLVVKRLPIARGTRYFGKSKMNFISLVNHGLSAMSTFADVMFARLLLVVAGLTMLFGIMGVLVVAVRLFTTVAVPGWATAALGFVALGLIQLLVLTTTMTFIQLASRNGVPEVPKTSAGKFLVTLEVTS